MPNVYCSKKLSDLVGIKKGAANVTGEQSDIVNDWNAHLFPINGRKCMIVTNKATLYSFVRLNILKKDLAELQLFFVESLFNQLKADGLDTDTRLNFWLSNMTNLNFYYTDNDKRVIGTMNEFIYVLKLAIAHGVRGLEYPVDTAAGSYINQYPMGTLGYQSAIEKMGTQ